MLKKNSVLWRAAFTLVELLVVVAIIGILIAMLLPAIQAAREAARRASCSNNLRQFGLGLHNYTDQYKQFPPGAQLWWMGARPHENWQIAILPFMDNAALYEAIDHRLWIDPTLAPAYDHKAEWGVFHGAGGDWHNAGGTMGALSNAPEPVWEQFHPTLGQRFRQIALPFMMCPSDPNARVEDDANPTWASTSYAGNTGNANFLGGTAECNVYNIYNDRDTIGNYYWGDFSWRSRNHSGVFSRWTVTGARLNDIQDGLSNTIAAGEVLFHCTNHRPHFWYWGHINVGMAGTTMPMNIFATCQSATVQDAVPFLACRGLTHEYGLSFGFRSMHPSGCNFLMCDDSVKFLLEGMDEKTYRNLGSKSDGFVIDTTLF